MKPKKSLLRCGAALAVFAAGFTTLVTGEASTVSGVASTVPLDEVIEGEHFWQFSNGQEFKGATGSLSLVKDEPVPGRYAMNLSGDFSGGGAYVAMVRGLEEFGLKDIQAIRLRYKTEDAAKASIQVKDGTGQVHQKKGIPLQADGQWHEWTIKPTEIAGGEHWGGANDGKWHGSPLSLAVSLPKPDGDHSKVSILLSGITADALLPAASGEKLVELSFEDGLKDWELSGNVAADAREPFKGKQSLVLTKEEKTLRNKVSAVSPVFPVRPGTVLAQFASRTDLESMDNSYNGSLDLEFVDGSGKPVGRTGLTTLFRTNNWKSDKKQVEVPAGASGARFVASINKETPGKFWLDDLSVSTVVGEKKDDRIRRMMFKTAQLGNLIYPEDPREVTVELWSAKPLPEEDRKTNLIVRDYWGAEQGKPVPVTLERKGKDKEMFVYEGKADLSAIPMETGRYYEVHGFVERKDKEPFTNYTSLAILPEAPANQYKPGEVPFTSRNWDNRITEYIKLTNRLGIRICGIWGKMNADPKKVEAPQLDLVEKLGMGYLTGSPAHDVEQRADGWQDLLANDGEKLRQGVRNYFVKYGKTKPAIVNLGNEPHSKGEDVKADVEAYRIVYEEIKKIDPSILVVGTSVGPKEDSDYAKYGYGKWCDAYDFHVYEDALSVRKNVEEKYPEMFKKFGDPKPVWSTELGLNSQGMARQFVAAELFRKTVNFFAGGGASMSWFGLLYPDADGKSSDSFGSAHNVFDCRYNRYAPKLDAIAYYNMVNAMGIKKFVEDKTFGDGTHAFLFRDGDGRALQVWYRDKGREDIFVPLAGVNAVRVIRIDGSVSDLDAGGKGVTLTVTEDPLLVLYEGGEKKLPVKPGDPRIRLGQTAGSLVRGEPGEFEVILGDTPADQVELKAPPFWKVERKPGKNTSGQPALRFALQAPEDSAVREANMTVLLKGDKGAVSGELTYRPPVTGTLAVDLLPVPQTGDAAPAVKLVVHNNSPSPQQLTWEVTLKGEQSLKEGKFSEVASTPAFFAEAASGSLELPGGESKEIPLTLSGTDLYKVYRLRSVVRDASGRAVTLERPVSAFYGVPKLKVPLAEGAFPSGADWERAPVRKLDNIDQFFAFVQKEKPVQDWKGAADLSAEISYLWDAAHLFVRVKVTDDIAGKITTADGGLWQMDGLQFLVDPMRTSERKVGKYEYSVGEGTRGPQTWCTLSADGAAPAGDVPEVKLSFKRGKAGTGDIVYEIAFPWSRLAPFKPAPGANLGLTLIVNEDDGNGRDSFMTWFGNAHSKDIDTVGDLILLE